MLESIPELEGKLLKPDTTKPASPDEIIKQTEAAIAADAGQACLMPVR